LVECCVCGSSFKPRRFDARTCSPACRQRLYRQRKRVVTDNEAGTQAAPFNIRNAASENPRKASLSLRTVRSEQARANRTNSP
jgi:hypothetical protein